MMRNLYSSFKRVCAFTLIALLLLTQYTLVLGDTTGPVMIDTDLSGTDGWKASGGTMNVSDDGVLSYDNMIEKSAAKPIAGNVVMEFEVSVTKKQAANLYVYQDSEYAFTMSFTADNLQVGLGNTKNGGYSPRVILSSYDADTWYKIRAELYPNPTDSAEASCINLYVDDKAVALNANLRCDLTKKGITRLLFNRAYESGQSTKIRNLRLMQYNYSPEIQTEEIIFKNDKLYGSYIYNDSEMDDDCSSFRWLMSADMEVGYSPVPGATEKSYAPDESMSGMYFRFEVTPADSAGNIGEPVLSPPYLYTYVYRPNTPPVAVVNNIVKDGSAYIGSYSFEDADEGDTDEGSLISWYTADEFFGEYEKIEGADTGRYYPTKEQFGKFLKFSVQPVDSRGVCGEEVESVPVRIEGGTYDQFNENEINYWTLTNDDGEVYVDSAPDDSSNQCIRVNRTGKGDQSNTMAYRTYNTPEGDVVTVEADVYSESGIVSANLFGVYSTGFNYFARVYTSGAYFLSVTGEGNTKLTEFVPNRWYRVKMVIFKTTNTVDIYIDDVKYVEGQSSKLANAETITGFATYLASTNVGNIYMDNLRITSEIDNEGLANADKELLEIGGNTDEITQDIPLPNYGENGSNIAWLSDRPDIITSSGGVNRPSMNEADTDVKLTAYIINGTYVTTKEFSVRVLRHFTDDESVQKDKRTLDAAIVRLVNDDYIHLPRTGENGTQISWMSDNESIIASDGTVRRGHTEEIVTLTATISKNGVSDTLSVDVEVLRSLPASYTANKRVIYSSQSAGATAQMVNDNDFVTLWRSIPTDRKPSLKIDMGLERIITAILLRENGDSITSFTVSGSEDDNIWSTLYTGTTLGDGKINIAEVDNKPCRYIQLTIDQKKDDTVGLYEFQALYMISDEKAVELDAADLNIAKTTDITSDFPLPSLNGKNGSVIEWSSSDEDIISVSGDKAEVTRPDYENKTVYLTAKVSKGDSSVDKMFTLIVKAKSSSSGGGGGGGGSGKGGSKSPAMPSYSLDTSLVQNQQSQASGMEFVDLKEAFWAEEYIRALYTKGIISGVDRYHFEPDRAITREEFVAIVVKAFSVSGDDSGSLFGDVGQDAWYSRAVYLAYNNGIINGVGENRFGIGEPITRQDMATIVYRVSRKYGYVFGTADRNMQFADDSIISSYAREGVYALAGCGVLSGMPDGSFNPQDNATRAQAAKIISVAMTMQGR